MQKILSDTSLVCATIGDKKKIVELLQSIISGSCIPCTIIIVTFNCLEILELIQIFERKKVRIVVINSEIASQVYQRNLGIASVTTEFIIQCDDDIRILFNSLEELHKAASSSESVVCSPRVVTPNGNSIYQKNYHSALLNKLIFLIFNFRWPKNALLMSSSGRNYAPVAIERECANEWLPSCLMYKANIFSLATTFTDKTGKGYFEDIIFTYSLFKKGINLKVANSSIFLHPKIESLSYSALASVFKKQLVVCRIFNLSATAAYCDISLYIIFFSLKKLKKCIFI